MTVSPEAYRDLADACQMRAAERDKYWGDLLIRCAEDHERRIKIARMIGMHGEYGVPPDWDTLLVRLNECLTTYRDRRGPNVILPSHRKLLDAAKRS